jgi:tRNA(fMet)-specific endonuclease VapC
LNRYLLDTNAWIALFRGDDRVAGRVRAVGIQNAWLCAPVWAELWYGACRSERRATNQERLREFFRTMAVLPFDDRAAETCGALRAELAARGQPIGPFDTQIAAIALTRGLVTVTRNVAEFARVPGLVVENWQESA